MGRGPINTDTDVAGRGAVIALDPHTGAKKWSFDMYDVNTSGILTTASDLLFAGGREGYFQALDAKQYIAIASGNALFAFALRE